jgi:hypothetical protein
MFDRGIALCAGGTSLAATPEATSVAGEPAIPIAQPVFLHQLAQPLPD